MDTYEKKYNEALEQAKKELAACGSMDCDVARLIFRLFPQLRESEDERIRKSLIELVEQFMSDERKEKTLAYLEKQKESLRDFIDDFPYSDVQKEQKPDTFNEPYNPDEYDVVMEGNAISLKRKEQKPYGQRDECKDCQANYAGSCKGTCEMKHPDGCFTCDEYKKGYEAGRSNGFTAGFNKAMKEQKPLTDDLDQEVHRFFEECITVHDAKIYGVEERVIPVDCYEVTARHFARWQKKQDYAEWNEEDETIIDVACNALEIYGHTKLAERLKSLRPSWKPSEEHLSALLAIFNDPDNIGSQTCQLALADLYEQLKKL